MKKLPLPLTAANCPSNFRCNFLDWRSLAKISGSNRQFLLLLNLPAFVHDPGDEDDQQADEELR